MSDTKKLVVIVTRGCDDERSSVAWSIANGGIASGYKVTMFLVSAGAWQAFSSLEDRNRFCPWIFRILHNCFISNYRKPSVRMNRGRTLIQRALWQHTKDAGLVDKKTLIECEI